MKSIIIVVVAIVLAASASGAFAQASALWGAGMTGQLLRAI